MHIETGQRYHAYDLDADVVIAADGVGSATRHMHGDDFGVDESVGRQRYIWCGVDRALPHALFAAVETEYGTFTTHAYPYREDRSTFLVETDERTWMAAGLDQAGDGLAAGESDHVSLCFLESIFAEHLPGTLLGNNSRWTQFRTVRCERWHRENVVLLGDAAHTAHYSVGSGTKLAMEDAIVLAEALARCPDPLTAFIEYETLRMPKVARLQELAHRSQVWWEGYAERRAMSPERLLASFLTRSGNVSLSDFHAREPVLAAETLRQYGGSQAPDAEIDEWVIAQPLSHAGVTLDHRDAAQLDVSLVRLDCRWPDPRASAVDTFIRAVPDQVVARGAGGVELDGPDSRPALLQRLEVAERIRCETGILVSVRGPRDLLPDLAAALVGGRTDLITLGDPAGRRPASQRLDDVRETA